MTVSEFKRNSVQEQMWQKGITYAISNKAAPMGQGLLCWACGAFVQEWKDMPWWTCPACRFLHGSIGKAIEELESELKVHGPGIEWHISPGTRQGVPTLEIVWEREVNDRRLTGISSIGVLSQELIEEFCEQIVKGVLRMKPTGEDRGSRRAYFIHDDIRADDGGYLVCIAEEGVKGYWPTDWNYGKRKQAAQVGIDNLNTQLGISKGDAHKITIDSVKKENGQPTD